jgi:hypothetical protein
MTLRNPNWKWASPGQAILKVVYQLMLNAERKFW